MTATDSVFSVAIKQVHQSSVDIQQNYSAEYLLGSENEMEPKASFRTDVKMGSFHVVNQAFRERWVLDVRDRDMPWDPGIKAV